MNNLKQFVLTAVSQWIKKKKNFVTVKGQLLKQADTANEVWVFSFFTISF